MCVLLLYFFGKEVSYYSLAFTEPLITVLAYIVARKITVREESRELMSMDATLSPYRHSADALRAKGGDRRQSISSAPVSRKAITPLPNFSYDVHHILKQSFCEEMRRRRNRKAFGHSSQVDNRTPWRPSSSNPTEDLSRSAREAFSILSATNSGNQPEHPAAPRSAGTRFQKRQQPPNSEWYQDFMAPVTNTIGLPQVRRRCNNHPRCEAPADMAETASRAYDAGAIRPSERMSDSSRRMSQSRCNEVDDTVRNVFFDSGRDIRFPDAAHDMLYYDAERRGISRVSPNMWTTGPQRVEPAYDSANAPFYPREKKNETSRRRSPFQSHPAMSPYVGESVKVQEYRQRSRPGTAPETRPLPPHLGKDTVPITVMLSKRSRRCDCCRVPVDVNLHFPKPPPMHKAVSATRRKRKATGAKSREKPTATFGASAKDSAGLLSGVASEVAQEIVEQLMRARERDPRVGRRGSLFSVTSDETDTPRISTGVQTDAVMTVDEAMATSDVAKRLKPKKKHHMSSKHSAPHPVSQHRSRRQTPSLSLSSASSSDGDEGMADSRAAANRTDFMRKATRGKKNRFMSAPFTSSSAPLPEEEADVKLWDFLSNQLLSFEQRLREALALEEESALRELMNVFTAPQPIVNVAVLLMGAVCELEAHHRFQIEEDERCNCHELEKCLVDAEDNECMSMEKRGIDECGVFETNQCAQIAIGHLVQEEELDRRHVRNDEEEHRFALVTADGMGFAEVQSKAALACHRKDVDELIDVQETHRRLILKTENKIFWLMVWALVGYNEEFFRLQIISEESGTRRLFKSIHPQPILFSSYAPPTDFGSRDEMYEKHPDYANTNDILSSEEEDELLPTAADVPAIILSVGANVEEPVTSLVQQRRKRPTNRTTQAAKVVEVDVDECDSPVDADDDESSCQQTSVNEKMLIPPALLMENGDLRTAVPGANDEIQPEERSSEGFPGSRQTPNASPWPLPLQDPYLPVSPYNGVFHDIPRTPGDSTEDVEAKLRDNRPFMAPQTAV